MRRRTFSLRKDSAADTPNEASSTIGHAAESGPDSLLSVFGLVKLDLKATRNIEEGDKTIAVVLDLLGKLNTPGAKFAHRLDNIVAVERLRACHESWFTAPLSLDVWCISSRPISTLPIGSKP